MIIKKDNHGEQGYLYYNPSETQCFDEISGNCIAQYTIQKKKIFTKKPELRKDKFSRIKKEQTLPERNEGWQKLTFYTICLP
jgi:hypothetical protein